MKRYFALITVISLIFSALTVNASAGKNSVSVSVESTVQSDSYADYETEYCDKAALVDISLKGDEFSQGKGVKKEDEYTDSHGNSYKNIALNEPEATAEYHFNVNESGAYNIEVTYLPINANGNDIKLGIKVDGEYPYSNLKTVNLPRYWMNDGEVRRDDSGNEYAPKQKEAQIFSTVRLGDNVGEYTMPYIVYLEKGEHIITVCFGKEKLAFAKLCLAAPEKMLSFEETKSVYEKQGYTSPDSQPIIIEAEDAVLKSEQSLVSKSDNSSVNVTPSDPYKDYCNYIGGSNWKNTGEEIFWEFNVPESGLYKIGTVFKQDLNMNLYSYRYLKIDGKTPFAECSNIKFGYDTGWGFEELGNGKEAFTFYLEKGNHTISLAVTLGETTSVYRNLTKLSDELGNIYLDISMITGESPDKNRDYELDKQIPDFVERLEKCHKKTLAISDEMRSFSSGKTNSFIAALENMARVIKEMVDKPYKAQDYISDYYSNYSTVTSWLYEMKSMSLSIDQIHICPADKEFTYKSHSILSSAMYSVKRFFASFASDYVKEVKNSKESIKIWINWGRDQAMVLDSLISDTFTPDENITVDLQTTNADIVKGMLSGNAPDLSLHLSRTEPVNLAMRGALYDLTSFNDYEDVIKRFGESANIPYKYGGGVYALPDTQAFYIMYYRSDVLSKLGLSVPKTWDEFLAATDVIQMNNMNVWLPYTQITAASTVNTGVGGLNLYASILQQFGGGFYNEEQTECELSSPVAYQAFKFWTEMYTKHKIPESANFYSRFRVGTIPLGIEVYTQYMTLKEAAPEIQGRWSIALVPGTENEDGTINHTVSGSGTGCAILNTSKNKAAAWKFLKWWTSPDTQLAYNNNVEAIIGTVSRTTTATLDAFARMSWDEDDLEILLEQRSWIKEIPEVPGSYYVSRSVDQAFWNVVDANERPRDTLVKWSDIANNEIKRKISEYAKVTN